MVTNWARPAIAAVLLILVYINANAGISRAAVSATVTAIENTQTMVTIKQVVANPQPIRFWRREILFGSRNNYYRTEYSLFDRDPVRINDQEIEVRQSAPEIVDIEKLVPKHPNLAAFLFWSRMPYDGVIESDGKRIAVVRDARFSNPLVAGRFSVTFALKGIEGITDPESYDCGSCSGE